MKDMPEDEQDEDVYEEDSREDLEENDEISPEEEGFMKGYEEGKKMSRCPKCGTSFVKDFIEREIDGEIYRFCSQKCAEKFKI